MAQLLRFPSSQGVDCAAIGDAIINFTQVHNEEAIPALEAAGTPRERLKAIILITNLGTKIVDLVAPVLVEFQTLTQHGAKRQALANWLSEAMDVAYQDMGYGDEMEQLINELGRPLAEELGEEIQPQLIGALRGPEARALYAVAAGEVQPTSGSKTLASDTKECPDCAETVKIKANVCRFCGYRFREA